MSLTEPRIPNRLGELQMEISATGFKQDSLVGSWFHDKDKNIQGCIVAEVAPQVYLCELFEWIAGTSYEQKLYGPWDMIGWHFYDTAEWMRRSVGSPAGLTSGTSGSAAVESSQPENN